jgi:hypothetical protein
MINSSYWGVMNDFYLRDLPEQVSGNNFKVPVDSVNRPHDVPFTMEQYFIMAKTIEPRFSLWQDYGFRKLIQDSINTAGYMLTKLGTDDARETQVMRVFAQKIQKSVADALITKLKGYLENKSSMTQPEVSFACYVFGETKDPAGKDILLQLTYDDNYKIRSSAVNALGKIKYDTTDTVFRNKVSSRLTELTNENSDKKLYRKDIAFAFGNYKQETNIPVLLSMLRDSYYGARFLAAEDLKSYGDVYINYINDGTLYKVSDYYESMNAFLYSLLNLSEGNFRQVVELTLNDYGKADGLLKENVIDIIRLRQGKSSEPGFLDWCNSKIEELQKDVPLKIK